MLLCYAHFSITETQRFTFVPVMKVTDLPSLPFWQTQNGTTFCVTETGNTSISSFNLTIWTSLVSFKILSDTGGHFRAGFTLQLFVYSGVCKLYQNPAEGRKLRSRMRFMSAEKKKPCIDSGRSYFITLAFHYYNWLCITKLTFLLSLTPSYGRDTFSF